MTTVTFGQRLRCERCEHEWNARSERKPVQCPRCKSTRWDLPPGDAAGTKPIKRVRSFLDLEAFGMWADRTETDEELLAELRSGWGDAPVDED